MDQNPFSLLASSISASDTTEPYRESLTTSVHDRSKMTLATVVEGPPFRYGGVKSGPMPTDENGCIIHEGLFDPGFILDCMAWDFIDDYTGIWKTKQLPPLHYFNCLRFWAWAHGADRVYPANIRSIPLPKKEIVSLTPDAHNAAIDAAYGLWAEDYHGQQKQQMFGARPLPAPVGPPSGQMWVDENTQLHHSPSITSAENPCSPSPGGISLPPTSTHHSRSSDNNFTNSKVAALPSRADSVVTSMEGSAPLIPDQRATAFSSTSSGSPVKRPSHSRRLSALAASFNPGTAFANPPLSSHTALPNPPGQLPGTFDVLSQNDKRNFTCLMITDVPFNVTINEILTHLKLGEREGLVHYGTDNPGIHIIQDRSDSKTHEVYVEMLSHEVAARVIRDMPRRGIKIGSTGGSRKIRIVLCAQEAMMRAIFPRPTKSHPWQFRWMGYDPDLNSIPNSFIGYVTPEDLHNAREWAEHPRKAKHADDAPQRVYEFMISTLVHLPKDVRAYGNLKGWRDVQDFVDRLFSTVVAMIRTLNSIIDDPKLIERHVKREHVHLLTFRLLKRFNQTCFDFPLFSDAQRKQLLMGV